MSALNLSAVMTGLAAAVQTVLASDRTAYDHPVEGVVPGDAVVAYPQEPIEVSTTFRRGQDRCVVPVFVICGLPQDETTRDAVSAWIDDSSSIVTAIEGYSGTWSSVAVLPIRIEEWQPEGRPPVLVIRFDVDVIA
jgi:hypothetical protein